MPNKSAPAAAYWPHVLGGGDAPIPMMTGPSPTSLRTCSNRPQAQRTDAIPGEAAQPVVQDGADAPTSAIAGPMVVGEGDAGRAAAIAMPSASRQVWKHGRELDENRGIRNSNHRFGNRAEQLRVLADLGAIALGVRAGHV